MTTAPPCRVHCLSSCLDNICLVLVIRFHDSHSPQPDAHMPPATMECLTTTPVLCHHLQCCPSICLGNITGNLVIRSHPLALISADVHDAA